MALGLLLVPRGAAAAVPHPPGPEADLALVNSVTWGATETGMGGLRRMGAEAWLQWQLHPPQGDDLPKRAQAQIDAMPISRVPTTELFAQTKAQITAANLIADPDAKHVAQAAYQKAMSELSNQAAGRDVLRALYAPSQLRERMAWFWFNHFNVHLYKADIRALVADYEERAIHPHALGRFRDLLMATLRHPAMLQFLDNNANAAGHINENYAREIMELHTMGVGSGYSQEDVQELARVLTGVGIDANPQNPKLKPELQSQLLRDGLFEFNPQRHDYGDKTFLGHTIKGSGWAEIEQAVDLLASQPATAHHISAELAQYFVADQPPEALVGRMAQEFTRTDGDIAAVLDLMFHAKEFAAGAHGKFKDPVRFVYSALRLAYGDRVIVNAGPVQGWLGRMGEGLYNRQTPDGYPMESQAWNGPGQMALRFEVARQIGFSPSGLFRPPGEGTTDLPGFPQLQNALYFDRTRAQLSSATRTALDQATSPQEWNQLFLSSPEFMY